MAFHLLVICILLIQIMIDASGVILVPQNSHFSESVLFFLGEFNSKYFDTPPHLSICDHLKILVVNTVIKR